VDAVPPLPTAGFPFLKTLSPLSYFLFFVVFNNLLPVLIPSVSPPLPTLLQQALSGISNDPLPQIACSIFLQFLAPFGRIILLHVADIVIKSWFSFFGEYPGPPVFTTFSPFFFPARVSFPPPPLPTFSFLGTNVYLASDQPFPCFSPVLCLPLPFASVRYCDFFCSTPFFFFGAKTVVDSCRPPQIHRWFPFFTFPSFFHDVLLDFLITQESSFPKRTLLHKVPHYLGNLVFVCGFGFFVLGCVFLVVVVFFVVFWLGGLGFFWGGVGPVFLVVGVFFLSFVFFFV